MKTIGIVCDDYKIPTFRATLRTSGYTFTEVGLTGRLAKHTIFKILSLPQDFEANCEDIRRICKKLEIDIKLSN